MHDFEKYYKPADKCKIRNEKIQTKLDGVLPNDE